VRPFRFIEHTGDLSVLVRGETPIALFANAADALFAVLTDRRRIRGRVCREIAVEAPGLEALLVGWLTEFLYLFDTEGMLFRRFALGQLDDGRLEALAWGEPMDEERHLIKTPIKAVTFHQLRIRSVSMGWQARVVFDV
jgi:SHS2 domain-containing protein